jgi:hypothetical protein
MLESGWIQFATLFFSGVAACSGIIAAVYTTKEARKKADRELLAAKLEKLFAELKEEISQTTRAVEIVVTEITQNIPLGEIFERNVKLLRPIWTEANHAEILVSLYFDELMDTFEVFRDHRTRIGLAFRKLPETPSAPAAVTFLNANADKMVDAYSKLRLEMRDIAKRICPRK